RGAELLAEAQRLVAMFLVEPADVADLDEHLVAAELLARPLQILERAVLVDDVRRELEEDAAKLPGRAQRFQRLQEPAEDLPAELARRSLDAAFVVGRRVVAEIGRQRLE